MGNSIYDLLYEYYNDYFSENMENIPDVVDIKYVNELQEDLGFRIPEDLIELLTRFANGGFGPGYGIVGVKNPAKNWFLGGPLEYLGSDHLSGSREIHVIEGVEVLEVQHPEEDDQILHWPRGMLQLCWNFPFSNESTMSGIDCFSKDFPVIRINYFGYEKIPISSKKCRASQFMGHSYVECDSFEKWLSDWVKDSKVREY
jgi:hypothetical protein